MRGQMSSSFYSSSSLWVSKAENGDVLEGLKVNGYVEETELVTNPDVSQQACRQ